MGLELRQECLDIIRSTLKKEDYAKENVMMLSDDYERFSFLYTFVKLAKKYLPKRQGSTFYSARDLKFALIDLDNIEKKCKAILPTMEMSYFLKVTLGGEKSKLPAMSMRVTNQLVVAKAKRLSSDYAKIADQFDKDFDDLIEDYNDIIEEFFPNVDVALNHSNNKQTKSV